MGWQTVIFSAALLMSLSARASDLDPVLVDYPLEKAFIPIGFDSNDRIQVAVEGVFPNTCYKIGPYHTHIDQVNKTIRVQQQAYVYLDWCLMVMVPFSQVIDIGLVGDGNYTLFDGKTPKELGRLPVTQAKTESADEYLYAPVKDAVLQDNGAKKYSLRLTGTFTDRCMKMKEVRVQYYEDVLVVQPIAEYMGTAHNCGHELIRFSHEVPLKEGLKGGFLLHVRVMNGQAINTILNIP